jgi:hypothetical protein
MEKTSVEDRRRRMEALREHLAEGAGQAARHDFVDRGRYLSRQGSCVSHAWRLMPRAVD